MEAIRKLLSNPRLGSADAVNATSTTPTTTTNANRTIPLSALLSSQSQTHASEQQQASGERGVLRKSIEDWRSQMRAELDNEDAELEELRKQIGANEHAPVSSAIVSSSISDDSLSRFRNVNKAARNGSLSAMEDSKTPSSKSSASFSQSLSSKHSATPTTGSAADRLSRAFAVIDRRSVTPSSGTQDGELSLDDDANRALALARASLQQQQRTGSRGGSRPASGSSTRESKDLVLPDIAPQSAKLRQQDRDKDKDQSRPSTASGGAGSQSSRSASANSGSLRLSSTFSAGSRSSITDSDLALDGSSSSSIRESRALARAATATNTSSTTTMASSSSISATRRAAAAVMLQSLNMTSTSDREQLLDSADEAEFAQLSTKPRSAGKDRRA